MTIAVRCVCPKQSVGLEMNRVIYDPLHVAARRVAAYGGVFMVATGELIRLMNYVDDIAATLRRINASLPMMTEEERKRLADYMRKSEPNMVSIIQHLESGKSTGA